MPARRTLLFGTMGGTAALLAAGRARAFSIEEVPAESDLGLMLQDRCSTGASAQHDAIKAELEAKLAREQVAPGAVVSAREVCPICGCPIIATRTGS